MIIKCPECGNDISDQADKCPNCGYPIHKKSEKKKAPAWKVILVIAIAAAILGGGFLLWKSGSLAKIGIPGPDDSFREDAEQMMLIASNSFSDGDATSSWSINGKKVEFKVRILGISSDATALEYIKDPKGTQKMIDTLAENSATASKAVFDKLTEWGHSGMTIRFEMWMSDDVMMTAVENGNIVYKLTKDNFRFG